MLVGDILKAKGSRVETARSNMLAADALKALTEKSIGALVVCDPKGNVMGILSERDLVHGFAEYGAGAMRMQIGQLMTADVISCSPEDDINHAMELMTARRFRHLPVMRDGKLAGIISLGDVVKVRLNEQANEVNILRNHARGY